MCGIVGFKTTKNYQRLKESLPKAADDLRHRGPDDSGLFFDEKGGIGFAHRRLSIIDLSSAGHQPMKSDNGDVHLIYNGEIYNFKEIRETLVGYGHTFKSSTDSEVALKAYLQWGIDCLRKFVGMFALAIWDTREQSLFLARDRLGIKPLYYHLKNGTFLFASELKSLMAFSSFERDIDSDAIPLFLHYQYIPSPRTIFQNTYKLLPGHFLIFNNTNISMHDYWKYPDRQRASGNTDMDENLALEKLDELLTTAVSDRLVSDVPLGSLLSGGIDSTVITALMQKVCSSPTKTFSIGFEEKGYNEAPWAARIARYLGTDHKELYVTPREAMKVIPRLPEIYDEPFADSSAIPTFLISKLTRSHVTVALSGDGGDEQFSGYVRYWMTKAMAGGFNHIPDFIKKTLAMILGHIPPQWIERIYLPWHRHLPQRFQVANFPDKWQKLTHLLGETDISELYRMTICLWSQNDVFQISGKRLQKSHYEETFLETEGWPVLSRLMRVDQKTYLPDAMLTKVDRASMATSLEVRVPLLDHRVVEFTSRLPENFKYRNGTGKYLLKKLLSRYVPTRLFERPKMGFGIPIDKWFRTDLKNLLLDYLSPARLKQEGLLNPVLVEKKIKEHLSGQNNHQYRLWSILMWEMWKERWLGG